MLRRSRTSAWRSPEASPASSTSRPEVSSGSTAASRPRQEGAPAVGSAWDARAGAAGRRFAALAAANVARPGQILVVSDEQARDFPRRRRSTCSPSTESRQQELRELGVRRLGELAGLPGGAVAERLGPDGRRAWSLARGGDRRRIRGRRPPAELVESLEFPEAIANELTLRRAFAVLLERLLDRPERDNRFVRKAAVAARLVGGGSWRRTVTLRDPTAEHDRYARARAEARGAACSGRRAAAGAGGAERLARSTARAGARRGPRPGHVCGGAAPGACQHRRRFRVHRRRGGTVVADPEARALFVPRDDWNEPRPALVVATGAEVPRFVNRQSVALARRGVARRRPLVDGGADRPPLLRPRARLGPERRRLPRRGAVVLVHPARVILRA